MSEVRVDAEAIQSTLKRAAAALRDAGVPFALAGSLAAWARGGPETTTDLDFILARDDAERALAALEQIGMRPERPPEGWLFKAWDGDVLVDLIFDPNGLTVQEIFERGEMLDVLALRLRVISLEDLLVTKLSSIDEHRLDFRSSLVIARALREKIDWADVRRRTQHSPYARGFFALLGELDIVGTVSKATRPVDSDAPRVQVVAPEDATRARG